MQILQEILLKTSLSPCNPCPACLSLNLILLSLKTSDGMHKGHSSCVKYWKTLLEVVTGSRASLCQARTSHSPCLMARDSWTLFRNTRTKWTPVQELLIIRYRSFSKANSLPPLHPEEAPSHLLAGGWENVALGCVVLRKEGWDGKRCAPGILKKCGLVLSHISFPSSSHTSGSSLLAWRTPSIVHRIFQHVPGV